MQYINSYGIDYVNTYIYSYAGKTIPYIYWYYAAFNILAALFFMLSGIAVITFCYYDTWDPSFTQWKADNQIMFSCVSKTDPTTWFGGYTGF